MVLSVYFSNDVNIIEDELLQSKKLSPLKVEDRKYCASIIAFLISQELPTHFSLYPNTRIHIIAYMRRREQRTVKLLVKIDSIIYVSLLADFTSGSIAHKPFKVRNTTKQQMIEFLKEM